MTHIYTNKTKACLTSSTHHFPRDPTSASMRDALLSGDAACLATDQQVQAAQANTKDTWSLQLETEPVTLELISPTGKPF